jgi:hypothetical protein
MPSGIGVAPVCAPPVNGATARFKTAPRLPTVGWASAASRWIIGTVRRRSTPSRDPTAGEVLAAEVLAEPVPTRSSGTVEMIGVEALWAWLRESAGRDDPAAFDGAAGSDRTRAAVEVLTPARVPSPEGSVLPSHDRFAAVSRG